MSVYQNLIEKLHQLQNDIYKMSLAKKVGCVKYDFLFHRVSILQ